MCVKKILAYVFFIYLDNEYIDATNYFSQLDIADILISFRY